MTCGNVWTCAVCSAKIQERRRLEISDAMEWAYTEGKKCIMVTFTFPHTAFDDLSDMLKKQAEAFKILRTGKAWQKYKEKIGFIGLIRALEITVGVNGWHPHTHELWIVDNSTNVNDLYSVVYKRWEKACIHTEILKSEKLRDFRKRAVNIKDNAVNSDYFAKFDKLSAWGVDREIAKASTKDSSGCHPFELLSDFTEKLPLSKEIRSDMFVNYSMSMYGKKQIYWSQGLKEIAGITEKTDEELCDESKEESVLFSLLNRKRVKYLYDNSSEQEIQYIAEVFGKEAAEEWFTDKGL